MVPLNEGKGEQFYDGPEGPLQTVEILRDSI